MNGRVGGKMDGWIEARMEGRKEGKLDEQLGIRKDGCLPRIQTHHDFCRLPQLPFIIPFFPPLAGLLSFFIT